MAYGIKYELGFTTLSGKKGHIYIYEKAYAGASSTLVLSSNGFSINRPFDREEPICGLTLAFEIVNDKANYFELIDLMTATERKYFLKVTHIDNGVTETILFEGFINTELSKQKYLHKQIINIVASSYLSKLEHTHPASADTLQYMTVINMINEILTATGSNLPINAHTCINPVEDTVGDAQTFMNKVGIFTEMFWENEKDRITSLDILQKLLTTFQCYLYYWDGEWCIEQFPNLWNVNEESGGNVTKLFVRYANDVLYGVNSVGTANSRVVNIKDVSVLKFTDMTQTLSITPGTSLLQIRINQQEFLNLIDSDLAKAIRATVNPYTPALRTIAYRQNTTTPWLSWDLLGVPFMDIGNSIKRTGNPLLIRTDKNVIIGITPTPAHYVQGLCMTFRCKVEKESTINIKFKYHPVILTKKDIHNHKFIFHWYLRCVETNTGIKYNKTLEEWRSYNYDILGEGGITNVKEILGSAANEDTETIEVSLDIPIGNLTEDPWVALNGNYNFVFCLGTEASNYVGRTKDMWIWGTVYLGDFKITTSGTKPDDNIIEGVTNEDFLNKKTITLDVADFSSYNYKNALTRGTDLTELTTVWTGPDAPPTRTLVDWLMFYKFRLHNISRQQITGEVYESNVLVPFSLYKESKQANKPFILTGYQHFPIEEKYEVQLDEFDTSTEISTTLDPPPPIIPSLILWVVGGTYISKSENGGKTWVQKYNTTTVALLSVSFLDQDIGFATGDGDANKVGCVHKTTDGGESWVDIANSLPAVAANKAIWCATKELSDFLYVGGNLSTFLLYNKATNTWSDISKGTSHNAYDMYAFSNTEVLSVTSLSASNDYGLKTTNSGVSWAEPGTFPQNKVITGVDFWGAIGLLISAMNATTEKLYKSLDNGATWADIFGVTEASVFSTDAMNGISFASGNKVFVVGCDQGATQGRLWMSNNTGDDWVSMTANLPLNTPKLNVVKFYNDNIGWIGTVAGDVLYTENGGLTWFSVSADLNSSSITGIMLIK